MSKDYLKVYGKPVRSLQQGGMAPAAPAPAAQQAAPVAPSGADLEGMLAEYAQTRDPQLAVAIADSLVEMVAQQGGGQSDAGGEVPMARKGGIAKAMIFKKKSKSY